jgi:thiosulfate dehydrogenase [quinone] large subunit
MKNRIDTVKQQPPTIPLPAQNTIEPNLEVRTKRILGWTVLPLRLFLGITFIYAGIQKLTDPQYFLPSAGRYIGSQIAAFASGSPIHGFLVNVAEPHAMLVGALVAYGELAIGLCALLGLLLRPAAFCGMLLNIVLFLSATWRVYPYFYGSDIVFIFCWITLLIAGPSASILPFPANVCRNYQAQVTLKKQSRRTFIWGIVTGGAGMLGLVWLSSLFHTAPQTPDSTGGNPVGTAPQATNTANPAGTPQTPGVIAQVSQVPANSAAEFTLPSNGDPGVLVHLDNGKFVAYDAACTHAGCPVSYDPGSKLLLCPCHGAAFDPAKDAAVVQGPAQTPLTSVPIQVDKATGTISLSS